MNGFESLTFFKENALQVFLEVEVAPKKAKEFQDEYHKSTGSSPSLGNGYQIQDNKWGIEYRIYFNANPGVADSVIIDYFKSHGISVEQGKRPYKRNLRFRVNDQNFFWKLINEGSRLGE